MVRKLDKNVDSIEDFSDRTPGVVIIMLKLGNLRILTARNTNFLHLLGSDIVGVDKESLIVFIESALKMLHIFHLLDQLRLDDFAIFGSSSEGWHGCLLLG